MSEFNSPGLYVCDTAEVCARKYMHNFKLDQARSKQAAIDAAWKWYWHTRVESGPSAAQAAPGLSGPAEPMVVLMQEQWGEEFER